MANPTKVKFDGPTQNTDGSPFNAADRTGFEFSFDGAGYVTGTVTEPTTNKFEALLAQFGLGFGSHSVKVRTVAKNGQRSVDTAPVSFTLVDERVPNPPTSLQVV